MSIGVIYLAVGERWYKEATFSAKSLKKYNPTLSCTLFTEKSRRNDIFFDKVIIIDQSVLVNKHPYQLKIWAMTNAPYTNTLFLDTDTEVKGPLEDLITLTQTYTIAIAPMIWLDRTKGELISYEKPNHFAKDPNSLVIYNTGVIAYAKSDAFIKFASRWSNLVKNTGIVNDGCDQSVFNLLLAEETDKELGVTIQKVPNTMYNVRSDALLQMRKDGLTNQIRILHDHDLHLFYPIKLYHKIKRKIRYMNRSLSK